MKFFFSIVTLLYFIQTNGFAQANTGSKNHVAPAPLFRDPITDGAADPVLIWNRAEKKWWMLYTQRRANVEAPDVAYCYGNDIGVASGEDNGQTWVYRGVLNLEMDKGRNTFWAPDVVYHNGEYHMFLVYIKGVRNHWGGNGEMAHYISKNLWDWKFIGFIKLASDKAIDASIMQMPGGTWRMWYKDNEPKPAIRTAESKDLYHWSLNTKPVLSNAAEEGPKVFKYNDYHWMITDEWHGMRVYRSKDANTWEKQGLILDSATNRSDDTPSGAHGDVIVVNNKAYVFYFTHPGRKSHFDAHMNKDGIYPFNERRSSIQVGQLTVKNGTLVCNRDKPFDFLLTSPD